MKLILLILTLLVWTASFAQEVIPVATVTPVTTKPIAKWIISNIPWDDWFKKNNIVTDKTEYVHFFWNAQDFKVVFEVKDKKGRLADAALQLVSRLYPSGAKADLVKVDIVYVLERDSYGEPKWDSLQQVAHFEFSKTKGSKLKKHKGLLADAQLKRDFGKIEIY